MVKEFFSEKENGPKPKINENISYIVFNGVIGLFEKYKMNLSAAFPDRCTDNNMIIGLDVNLFMNAMRAVIPDFEISNYRYLRIINEDSDFDQYALLDFIEYCWSNIQDYQQKDYHKYFSHYHLSFDLEGTDAKNQYADDINQIFQRNGLAFKLSYNGSIERVLPILLDDVIKNYSAKGNDPELNKLIAEALEKIIKPKVEDRQVALEKLWDAFERLKTYLNPGKGSKKTSSDQLTTNASEGQQEFKKLLDDEMILLTKIGNEFRIRHHEQYAFDIKSGKHLDYLFYRMMSLISFLVRYI